MTSRPVNERPESMGDVVAALPPILREIRATNRRMWEAGVLGQPSHLDRAVLQVFSHVYAEGAASEHRVMDEHRALGLTRLGVRIAINNARGGGFLVKRGRKMTTVNHEYHPGRDAGGG